MSDYKAKELPLQRNTTILITEKDHKKQFYSFSNFTHFPFIHTIYI